MPRDAGPVPGRSAWKWSRTGETRRVLLDAALTADFDEARALGLALAWLLGLGLLVGGLYRRAVAPAQTPTAEHALHEGAPLR